MTYIHGIYDSNKDLIHIVERDQNGKRHFKEYTPEHSFYFSDQIGDYTSIFGEKCSKFSTSSKKLFRRELHKLKPTCNIFESDIPVLYKALERYYKNEQEIQIPKLNICFFDIETDFSREKGFAKPSDPFNEITAISLYNNWEDICYTLVVAPKGMKASYAKQICEDFDHTHLCANEEELLRLFIELIQDADILTGWNSEMFDIPYIVGRIYRVLGKDYARRLCHWNVAPKSRTFERFGEDNITYDLVGRIHLDYLQLYKKFTYHEMHSYALDAVGEAEVGEKKVSYEGSLDKLYNEDFPKFIEYSRQDVMLMVKIDVAKQFISLINTLCHDNCVFFQDTLGTVKLTDFAIILESHERGFVVPDKVKDDEDDDFFDYELDEVVEILGSEGKRKDGKLSDYEITKILDTTIAGAYVADPKKGMSHWVGSVDITSLYPSVIMALNISPETIYGQVDISKTRKYLFETLKGDTSFADAWNNKFHTLEMQEYFDKSTNKVKVHFESNKKVYKTLSLTGREIFNLINDNDNELCISANGTIFTYKQKGIIPELLAKWFADRKRMQAKAKELAKEIANFESKDDIDKIKNEQAFWDQRQLIKKIQLNSLYGAITNPHCRFFDQRMGQSITLTGRCIARHMAAKINEILTGKYDYLGETILYGDTDSVYFSAYPIRDKLGFEFTSTDVVPLYDAISAETNQSFPQFMIDTFCTESERAKKIKADREIVAKSALFVKKKRYAANVIDIDGVNVPEGKLKIMGMETQRSDTPKFIQVFLKELLKRVLNHETEESVISFIRGFREKLHNMKPWEMGTPKTCNKLTYYTNLENMHPQSRLPGHIRAAYNWNKMKRAMGDGYSLDIPDGGKTIVCRLKTNQYGIKSISYPVDQVILPDWFKELPFDIDDMETILIDKKVDNLIGILKYNISASKQAAAINDLFSMV